MEKVEGLPTYADATTTPLAPSWRRRQRRRRAFRVLALACVTYFIYSAYSITRNTAKPSSTLSIERLHADYATCASLRSKPTDPSGVRKENKRWVETTKPFLIRNATVWTGEPQSGTSEEAARAGKGWAWISLDVLVDKGLISHVQPNIDVANLPKDIQIFDARGRRLTAGIVDMHSHAGLGSVANLDDDTNELSSDVTPYVRSLDGIDPLQPEIEFIKSGGVTTSLFLPGSGNNMGGEAFVLKLAVGHESGRAEVSQEDMFADPDKSWRYMKMACGENPKRVYGKLGERGPFSRLGEAWRFRRALEQATKYVQEQDEWCAAADRLGVESMGTHLRQELEWESLAAVLRGQVRVNTHCYTIADLEAFVRHTNEFKFRVYAFHHAHQTYLVPEILKRAWGGTPAAALFADNMYYKVEAYRASERAGAILYAQNITPTYVSDNPVLNSQHVVFEAAKAHGNGLPYHAALAGVTSAPAELLGLGRRVGKIKPGFDADIVVWDSDPLSVGATPVQVWIDGAKQFKDPIELKKPVDAPEEVEHDFADEEENQDMSDTVVFKGISHVHRGFSSDTMSESRGDMDTSVAIVSQGRLSCVGTCTSQLKTLNASPNPPKVINLKNGHLTPPLTAFGTALGLQEIDAAPDTHDGSPPSDGISLASVGLSFGGKQLEAAHEHGVTRAISAPTLDGINSKGLSVGFSTGAHHSLEPNSIWKNEVALHYPLTLSAKNDKTPSISSAIQALAVKLLDAVDSVTKNDTVFDTPRRARLDESAFLTQVLQGTLPLVLTAHSADTITAIIRLKAYIEAQLQDTTTHLRIVLLGGAEAHLVAPELAAANISLVLAPLLPHAQSWDQRRGLTGPPLTDVASNVLLDAGVKLGISVEETWESRDLRLLAGIAWRNSEGRLSVDDALDLVGGGLEELLGVESQESAGQWIVWEGNPLEIGARVRGVSKPGTAGVWV
ncbi:hypothetical protein ACN47E_000989 [Coniothyrium glycines]